MKKLNKILSIACAFSLVVSSLFCTTLLNVSAEESTYDIIYKAAKEYVSAALNETTADELLAAVQKVLPEATLDTANDYFIKHAVPGVSDDDTEYPLSILGSDGAVAAVFGYQSQRIGVTVGFAHDEEVIHISETAVVGKSDGFTYDSDGNVTAYSGTADKMVFPNGYSGTMTALADKTAVNNIKVVIINNNVILKTQAFTDWASLKAVQFGSAVTNIFQSNIGLASFQSCPELKYALLPKTHDRDGNAWWTIATNYLFENCVKLENLVLPYNISGAALSHGYRAFYNTAVRDFFLHENMLISNESYDSPSFSKGTRNVITYDTDMTFVRAAALAQAAVNELMRADSFTSSDAATAAAINAISGSHDSETFKAAVTAEPGEWSEAGSDLGGIITLKYGSDAITLNCVTKNQNEVLIERVQKAFTEYVTANKNNSTAAGLLNAVKAVNSTAALADEDFAIYYAQPGVTDTDETSGYKLNIPGNDGAVAATLNVAGFDISCASAFERGQEIIKAENIAVAGADNGKLTYDESENIIGCAEGVDKIIIPSDFTGTFAAAGEQSLSCVKTVIIRNTVSIIKNAFDGKDGRWNSLTALDINGYSQLYWSGTNIMVNANVNGIPNLKYVALPRCLDNNWIDNYAFQNLPSLATVNIPVYCAFNYECFYNTGIKEFILSAKYGLGWGQAGMIDSKNFTGGQTVSTIGLDTPVTDVRAAAWITAAVNENNALSDDAAISAAKTALKDRAWSESAYNYFDSAVISYDGDWNVGDNGIDTRNITVTHGESAFYATLTKVRAVPEIAMEDGVEICTENGYGLNFACTVKGLGELLSSGAAYKLYTMIIPADYLQKSEFTAEALENAGLDFITVPISVYKSENSVLTANAAITNIKTDNYNRDFVARSYMDITYSDGANVRYYADYSLERNADSAYNTAIRLLNDSENPITDGKLKNMLQKYVDEVESNKESIMYVDYTAASNEFYVVQNYSAAENMVMQLKPTGINKLLNIAPPKFIANNSSKLSADVTSAYERSGAEDTSESDWLGPHFIDYTWFGGTHGTNGEGGYPTAFMDNVQIKLNGKSVDAAENIASYAASLTVKWDVYAGATNKEDCYVIEHHTMRFDGRTWHVETELEFNKDCTWNAYYGIQAVCGPFTGVISYDGGEEISLEGSSGYSTTSGNADTHNVLMHKNSDYLNMYLDTGYGLGKRELCDGSDGAFTVTYNAAKNGKAYFRLVSNAAVKKGDKAALKGSYTFYSSKPLDDEVYDRSVVNSGNAARIAAAMKKAQNGEPVTVGVIGGSITQGSGATSGANCYASLVKKWWEETFPQSRLTFINAGKGDTTSLMGVARVEEDLLCYNPDFVIAEFSVNDPLQSIYGLSYEGLVRKILNSSSKPGLLLLQTMNNQGINCAEYHTPVGMNYNLPIISYKEALWPTGSDCMYQWGELSNDTVHPNDFGHSIVARLITHYLENIAENVNCFNDSNKEIAAAYNASNMENAVRYNHDNFTPEQKGIFEDNDNTYQLGSGWTATGSGEAMTFTVNGAKQIYIVYYWDASGQGGKADISANGKALGTMNGDFSGGWNRLEVKEVLNGDEPADCTVSITPTSDSGKKFTIAGIIVSK